MRKCEKCSVSTSKPVKVVVERVMVKHAGGGQGPRGGVGTQIVKELTVCESCVSSVQEAPMITHIPEPVVQATPDETFPDAA